MMALLATVVTCYVGSNPGSPDHQALHALACDPETGAAKLVQNVNGCEGTTYFQIDKAGKHLYSAIAETRNGKKASAAVRFALDGETIGKMEKLAELPCETPCHVSLLPGEKKLAFAAYSSATAGTLPTAGGQPVATVMPNVGMGPNAARQKKAYAHFSFTTPDGKKLGIIDLGCDKIHFYDPETMVEDTAMTIRADPGDGPRHAVWAKDSRFLYVLNELGNSVLSFAFDGRQFTRVGKWSMLPKDFAGDSKAAAIKLTADGRVLMASNRGHDSIAMYDVDTEKGTLKLRNIAKLTGSFPRDFELMPGEKFMVVGHKMSNEIQVYRFDRKDLSLTPVGAPIAVWRPLCFKFKENTTK